MSDEQTAEQLRQQLEQQEAEIDRQYVEAVNAAGQMFKRQLRAVPVLVPGSGAWSVDARIEVVRG